ncbi:MAG: 23S rRNA (guanosine(2251)-2'-O)-methyltransferase RlmB [Deltaproteobacteria bacterium]|jgi:23S rRNA (guanosine2251-2'-O)-methyltransferase|nr:23S rRNA (guanosine(2251)-2'-O)-methyltransferase RlmB [Deltaproteobacteria bacterium]
MSPKYSSSEKEKKSERIVYGKNPIRELLEQDQIKTIFYSSDQEDEIIKKAKGKGVKVEKRYLSELDQFVKSGNHQGLVALAYGYDYADFDLLLETCRQKKGSSNLIFLDRIMDPHNLGAVARSAYLLGMDGLIISLHKTASVTSGTVKASVGATNYLPIARVINMGKSLDQVKEAGFQVAALDMSGKVELPAADFVNKSTALVVGSEHRGIRPSLLQRSDFGLQIPMTGKEIGSFNASVAASLVMYEIYRQSFTVNQE